MSAHKHQEAGIGSTPIQAEPFALEVIGLHKSFNGLKVTDNVNLRLAPGARHALIGPNGAGKSTLIALLSGVLRPDSGAVSMHGLDITRYTLAQRVKLGLVRTFQITSLFTGLTALENVYLAVSECANASGQLWRPANANKELLERSESLLNEVGLQDIRHRPVDELAYGQQRLLEIALALALKPKVLLLDEPAAGIPSSQTDLLLDALERLPRDIAILLIEHDMQLVRRFASDVTVLVEGCTLTTGTPRDVMNSEAVRKVYLGTGSEFCLTAEKAG